MQLSIIVALSRNLLIGTETGLPWHLPADLKQFRRITMGKPVILGRKTMESCMKRFSGFCLLFAIRAETRTVNGKCDYFKQPHPRRAMNPEYTPPPESMRRRCDRYP